MESHPQNPEFRNNPENFHPCMILRCFLFGLWFQVPVLLSSDFFKTKFFKTFFQQ